MNPTAVTEILSRPPAKELLGRDLARLAFVAPDGTPRAIRSTCSGTASTR